jgi:hypothetical protein
MTIKPLSQTTLYLFSALFVVSVLFLNIGIWFQKTVFDETRSKGLIVASLQEESSRDAIAAEITAKSLSQWPRVENMLGDTLESKISDFIASPLGQPIIKQIADSLFKQFTTNQTSLINIDTRPLVQFLIPRMPDSITGLFDRIIPELPAPVIELDAKMAQFYEWGSFFSRYAPIALVVAVFVFALLLFKSQDWRKALQIMGVLLALGTTIVILLLDKVQAELSAAITNPNIKILASNLYTAYADIFEKQSLLLLVIGLILALIGTLARPIETFIDSHKKQPTEVTPTPTE